MMVGGATVRPRPPSPNAIIQDVLGASGSDPVFKRLTDAIGTDAGTKVKVESIHDHPSDTDVCYQKVCELLDNLSSIRTGKDRLNKAIEEVLSCKEDVSAMSLELKTRLEMHKASNTKSGH